VSQEVLGAAAPAVVVPGEPELFVERRRAAFGAYQSLPIPARPRTPLKARRLDSIPYFTPDPTDAEEVPAPLREAPASAGHMVLANGQVTSAQLASQWRERGVELTSLMEAARRGPDRVASHLGALVPMDQDRYTAANAAGWRDGVWLYVPRGTVVTEPITIVHWVGSHAHGVFPRTLVVAEPGAQVHVVEMYLGDAADDHRVLVSAVTEVVAGDGSQVTLFGLQQLPPGAETFLRRRAQAGHDARVDWATAEFGSALSVSGHHTDLVESGAATSSYTVSFGSEAQHFDYDAEVVHVGPHTTSTMRARTVMSGRSRSIFTGLGEIRKGARGADARQKEETLMLSADARADAIPSLLIGDNDVFAAHAASAGPVDELALYYLATRGIPREDAIDMLVRGFLGPVVEQIALPAVQERVWAAIETKLQAERGRLTS